MVRTYIFFKFQLHLRNHSLNSFHLQFIITYFLFLAVKMQESVNFKTLELLILFNQYILVKTNSNGSNEKRATACYK
jgi:hypothetical protein